MGKQWVGRLFPQKNCVVSVLFPVSLGLLVLLGSCAGSPPASVPSPDSHMFNPSEVEPGDTVAGLRVVSVDITPFQDSREFIGTVQFDGEITVRGTYSPNTAFSDGAEGIPCFYVDETSETQLPRFQWDERNSWFCFSNPDAVKQAFPDVTTEQENTTLVIDDYVTIYAPTDVVNEATFVRIGE